MTDKERLDFVLRVMRVTQRHPNMIWWRTDGEYAPVTLFVGCNDLFYWGCADAEPVTSENVGELEKAFADAVAAHRMGVCYGGELFCCRVRGMRPQGCCYPSERGLWPLFDACGPEREVGLGNPYPPGGKKAGQPATT